MNTIRVNITGESPRELVSKKTGNTFTLLDIYVMGSAPFPEKITTFENPRLPAGWYDVPVKMIVQNERLTVSLDFSKATAVTK